MNKEYDIVVLGGGSAGMASALRASEQGLKVAIIERENRLGGILNQCIHNGFGLNYFKQELTGPEYAKRFSDKVKSSNIEVMLETTILDIKEKKSNQKNDLLNGKNATSPRYEISCISPKGAFKVGAKAVVCALGCRERPSGAINLCGTRPAGVMSAGSAQKMVNIYGKMVGKNIVIVGSGDIGLIMARRLRYEGGNVLGVYEVMPHPSGLKRNIVQCLEDYNIPLHLSKTVVEVVGETRVEGVWVAPVKSDFSFDLDKKEFIPCDTVILSIGLVPENDLLSHMGVTQNLITGGAKVDEYLMTDKVGVFSCGNVLHVHDIVDNVSKESERAGENAGKYVKGLLSLDNPHDIQFGSGLRYINPTKFYESDGILTLNFRSSAIFRNCDIVVTCGEKEIRRVPKKVILPAEMETVILSKMGLKNNIKVYIESR